MPSHRLFFAVLVSLLLHGLLLWFAQQDSADVSARYLRGKLLPTNTAIVQRAYDDSMHQEVSAPLIQPVSTAKSVAVAALEKPMSPVEAMPLGVRPSATANSAPSLALPTDSAGPDAGGLRQYRIGLAAYLRNLDGLKRRLAPGMQMRMSVRINVAGGVLLGVELARSSGNPAIDEAMVDAVRQSAQSVAIPSVLHGQSFSIELPIEVEG